jgi:hypothetical protein
MTYYRDEWTKSFRDHLARCDREEKNLREAKIHLEMHKMNEPFPLKHERDSKGKRLIADAWFDWLAELGRLEHNYRKMP